MLRRIIIVGPIEADVSGKRSKVEWGNVMPGRLAIAVLLFVAGCLASVSPTRAEDWMFRRSYYSHVPEPPAAVNYPLPESRSAYRRAYVGRGFGFSARSVYRYNTLYLRSGNSQDVTIFREHRFELRPSPWSVP